MKKTDNTIKKLAAYSAVAATVMGVSPQANAEVVGYDVDPDSMHILPDDTAKYYFININNQGAACDTLVDMFLVLTSSYDFYSWKSIWGSIYYGGAFYGRTFTYVYSSTPITTTGGGTIIGTITSTWNLVGTFSPGSSVGPFAPLPPGKWLTSTYAFWSTNYYYSYVTYSWGDWKGGKTGKYVGLKFYAFTSDIVSDPGDTLWDSTLHYGWIYMDVGILSSYFTIRAWAYETTPNTAIEMDVNAVNYLTGECPLTVGVDDRNLADKVSVYSYDRNVRVSLDGMRNKGNISIYNATGQKIQEQAIKGSSNLVNIKGNSRGVYMVKVDVDGVGTRTKKVYIN